MKARWILLAGTMTVLVLGVTGYATSGVSPLRSDAKSTVVPPANFNGTAGVDELVGTNGNDNLAGMGGADTIRGKGGNDVLRGGAGNDHLFGGSGRDILLGDQGNDNLTARDGERDVVTGGPGVDRAWVDQLDIVRGVERVFRKNVEPPR